MIDIQIHIIHIKILQAGIYHVLDVLPAAYAPFDLLRSPGEKLGGNDILKATPIPTGILKKVKNLQFISTSKKKAVKKAQKILKDLDDTSKYQVIFRSSSNKTEKIAIYAYPARSERFSEVVLLINEHDRQLTLFQLLGEFSMEDVNDIEEELNDDKTQDDEDLIIIDASKK